MRLAVLGVLASLVLLISAAFFCFGQQNVLAQPASDEPLQKGKTNDQLIAFSSPAAEGRQQVVLIDPALRTMSVYHIELATGEISLKSVRRFHWDLQMEEFNGQAPLPREIRSLIERR